MVPAGVSGDPAPVSRDGHRAHPTIGRRPGRPLPPPRHRRSRPVGGPREQVLYRPGHGRPLRARHRIAAQGRPAPRDRGADGGPRARRRGAGPARDHRQRQDLHDGERHRPERKAGPDHRAQQDSRRPALRRDARALPEKRRRVLRQLLRLLPARGLRPLERYVHREGRDRERSHRPDAAQRDPIAALAQGRDHRRERLLHLRHRLGRVVPRDARRGAARGGATPRRVAPAPGRHPVPEERHRLPPRHLPRARRRGRAVPGPLGERRGAHRVLG